MRPQCTCKTRPSDKKLHSRSVAITTQGYDEGAHRKSTTFSVARPKTARPTTTAHDLSVALGIQAGPGDWIVVPDAVAHPLVHFIPDRDPTLRQDGHRGLWRLLPRQPLLNFAIIAGALGWDGDAARGAIGAWAKPDAGVILADAFGHRNMRATVGALAGSVDRPIGLQVQTELGEIPGMDGALPGVGKAT